VSEEQRRPQRSLKAMSVVVESSKNARCIKGVSKIQYLSPYWAHQALWHSNLIGKGWPEAMWCPSSSESIIDNESI